jgi:hypothetical protein
VRGQQEVRIAASDLVAGVSRRDNDGVADDGAEPVDLSAQLDLDRLALLQLYRRLGLIRGERGVWGDEGGRRNGRGVGDSFEEVSLDSSWSTHINS